MEKIINKLLIFTLLGTIALSIVTYKFRNAEHDSLCEEEFLFERCEYIDIDVSRMNVVLIPYDEPHIKAVYKNDRPLEYELGDNRLSLTESSKLMVSLFTGDESDYSLQLYLPKEFYREITVYTGVGGIIAGRIDALSFTAGSDSGDILLEQSISRLNLSTTSGKITADCEMLVDGTEIQSRRGDVELIVPDRTPFTVDFETQTGYCNCKLTDAAPMGNYEYNFNGGGRRVGARITEGTLTITEKTE